MKKTWLYLLCGAVFLGFTAGCGGVNALLRGGNTEQIYKKAQEYYAAEKWSRASTLFEAVQHVYNGTTREDSIAYFTSYCKYKSRDYLVATEMFDQFRRNFGRSVFIEEAEGLYALCFYHMSPPPMRDQTMTTQARIAINEFISRYPQSKRIENFRKMDEDLIQRLHEKAYTNAYTYYKTARFKSATVALRNALKDYPDSKYREEIMYLIVDSNFRLAENSISNKQTDRYLSMLDSYYSFVEEFPESVHTKELERMAQHAKDYLDKNNKDNNQ